MQNHIWSGVSTFVGTVLGAGILAIPYAVQKSGFWTGLTVIIIVGLAVLLMNLMLGEVVLRTKGNHQLTGYSKKYLGIWGERAMLVSMLVGIYGALIAFTIGSGASLATLFKGSPLLWSGIFYAIMSVILWKGLRTIEKLEDWLSPGKLALLGIVLVFAFMSSKFSALNLSGFSVNSLLVPYGVVLFALIGTASIPEVKEETKSHWKDLKKILIIGSLIPLIAYLLFTIAVIGVTGINTTEIATLGLSLALGSGAGIFIHLFAIIAMSTAFMTLSLALKEMFVYDYGWSELKAIVTTLIVPLLALFVGVQSFAGVLGVAGALAGGIDGVLIVLMFWRAKNKGERIPEYELHTPFFVGMLLILMFILGAVHAFL